MLFSQFSIPYISSTIAFTDTNSFGVTVWHENKDDYIKRKPKTHSCSMIYYLSIPYYLEKLGFACCIKNAVFALPACHFANGYHLANWAIKLSFWRNI